MVIDIADKVEEGQCKSDYSCSIRWLSRQKTEFIHFLLGGEMVNVKGMCRGSRGSGGCSVGYNFRGTHFSQKRSHSETDSLRFRRPISLSEQNYLNCR